MLGPRLTPAIGDDPVNDSISLSTASRATLSAFIGKSNVVVEEPSLTNETVVLYELPDCSTAGSG